MSLIWVEKLAVNGAGPKANLRQNIRKIPDAVEPVEAAEKLWEVVKSKSLEDTGKFWHREGMELPW